MKQNKKQAKTEGTTNVLLSLGAAIIAYFAFNYFNPSMESMFVSVIFLLVFNLLQSFNK